MRVGRRALGMVVMGACAACAPTSQPSTIDAQRGSLVQLDVTYTRELAATSSIDEAVPRLEAEAHFIRYRAADPQIDRGVVATLLGLGDDASIPVDSCRAPEAEGRPSRLGATQGAGAVEVSLLDAGPLSLRLRDGAQAAVIAQLEPQRYPELFPFVSGVVYGHEQYPAPALPQSAALELEADGGEDVGPFLAAGTVPTAFPDLYAWRDPSNGELQLGWTGNDSRATVMIDVRWAGGAPGSLRCRARDDGSFTIAPAQLPGLAAAIASGGAQASVARSENATLDAPGAGSGTLTVTLRDTFPLESTLDQGQ
jgi:hypothetical protein